MTSPYDAVADVHTREDLARFIACLLEHLRSEGWPNDRLDLFLDGLGGWVSDMPGYFLGRGENEPPEPSWGLVAQMLLAATVYD